MLFARKLQVTKHLSQTWEHRLLLGSLPLVLHLLFPHIWISVILWSSTWLHSPGLHCSVEHCVVPTNWTLHQHSLTMYLSIVYFTTMTRPPMVNPQKLSSPDSPISPFFLRCWQQIKQNTEHVYLPLLLPFHTTIFLLFFKLLARWELGGFWNFPVIICELMRIKNKE